MHEQTLVLKRNKTEKAKVVKMAKMEKMVKVEKVLKATKAKAKGEEETAAASFRTPRPLGQKGR